jgi:ankyrin repeat protein
MVRRIVPVAAAIVAAVLCASPTSAQKGKMSFADVMQAMNKCKVDDIKSMITGVPSGGLDAQTAAASQNAFAVDASTIKDTDGTPLLVAAAATDCVEGVHVLLNNGGDVNDTDKNGRTALHAAAASSTQSMVQLLVERHSDVNAKDKGGDTPLSLAKTNNYKGKTDQRDKIVKYLTGKGAKDKS